MTRLGGFERRAGLARRRSGKYHPRLVQRAVPRAQYCSYGLGLDARTRVVDATEYCNREFQIILEIL